MRRGRMSWLDRLGAQRHGRVLAAIDARVGTARDLYDQVNLRRAVSFSTFRRFVSTRRRDRAIRSQGGTTQKTKPIRADEVKAAVFRSVIDLLDAGRFNASMLREVRLLLVELGRLPGVSDKGNQT